MTANDIEIAVAEHFNYRQNLIVPNVSWGLNELGHEADMLILRPSGWLTEIEIKIRGSDIHMEKHKKSGHLSRIVQMIYFAVPENLIAHKMIPRNAGILGITVGEDLSSSVRVVRTAQVFLGARKITHEEKLKIALLGAMRIWTLKSKLQHVQKNKEYKKNETSVKPVGS
jgi:hypothetical protein